MLRYIESKQKKGIYHILRQKSLIDLNINSSSFNGTTRRLTKKDKLFKLHPNFYVIVPLEFEDEGCPPPDRFFDAFMEFLGQEYYVSLLSAITFHQGESLTYPEFQVIVKKRRHSTKTPPYTIRYFNKTFWPTAAIKREKTSVGFLNIASPELTAFDLMRYPYALGEDQAISGILKNFVPKLKGEQLAELAERMHSPGVEVIYWQRLGYLLDQIGELDLTAPLARWIEKVNPISGYLYPPTTNHPIQTIEKNTKWKLLINQMVGGL